MFWGQRQVPLPILLTARTRNWNCFVLTSKTAGRSLQLPAAICRAALLEGREPGAAKFKPVRVQVVDVWGEPLLPPASQASAMRLQLTFWPLSFGFS